ncbi:transcriptional regulator GutM [Lacticaseibacillus paracasei]|uniref:Transcriptional regulator GutM n=1 Tax=Lacticaseibacillus paracasei TaxID=1597 RepID=A0ABD5D198_LACPA|nr:transcriptional regulator GutM [Lacticaseibacillus paracasei]EPC96483.1 hypothetical protein Lpp124_00460 [Lacticaseibacillus paracasei subsp. paracasei CNCM I-4649]MDR7625474.1 transcriptional regulator GutM [Lacticaseibacillus paracasei]QPC12927.1 hypothetical protein LacP0245_12010 [Lacticaseibacillus paracasei subsp. tolerans]QUS98213.1 hypothetical protein KFU60_12035 [Lacticaseibacillus paracasei subsp. tolerans]WMX60019.1 transcriptional regulator GutM [Lacticaseibacillus paracasei]
MRGILFISFIVIVVIVKQLIGIANSQMYVREYKRMIVGHHSGRFGVGVHRPKFGIGEICFIIVDDDGRIIACKILRGLSVFAKFKCFDAVIDKKITDDDLGNFRHSRAIKDAIKHAYATNN